MWRVFGSRFSWFSTVQPSMSGRNTSSDTAVGRYLRASAQRLGAVLRDQRLEAAVAREVQQHLRVVRIVLDDQQRRARRARGSRDRRGCPRRAAPAARSAGTAPARSSTAPSARRGCLPYAGPMYVERQIQRERAAAARHAGQADLAAEQMRQLAADGETEARAAVLARGAGVGLLERLEDDPLLLRRNADAGIAHRELDHRRRLRSASGDPSIQPPVRHAHVQAHAAVAR